jgi:hypothetical protein
MMRPSPLQNRVTPNGEIIADPGRGLFTGNRGCLHGPDYRLGSARWRSKLWICCALEWKGVRRDPMPAGRWTALFFLDEATALAAGHRPCAFCRRDDYNSFVANWMTAHAMTERPKAVAIDTQLHDQRVDPRSRRQRTRSAVVGDLPDGVMLRHAGKVGLLLDGRLHPWSSSGYGPPVDLAAEVKAELLTPPATAATIAAGYRPVLHPTATPHAAPARR